MRDIKFRAWNKRYKIMIYDIQKGEKFATRLEMESQEVMQYTGLKDKNDKEIYEGDIVELNIMTDITVKGKVIFDTGIFEIKYEEKTFGRLSEPLRGWISKFDNRCSVIGNIYENPELLEGCL